MLLLVIISYLIQYILQLMNNLESSQASTIHINCRKKKNEKCYAFIIYWFASAITNTKLFTRRHYWKT